MITYQYQLYDSNASLPPFTPRTENTLNFIHIEESEIVDVVETLIVNKASGDDQISHRKLKTYMSHY